MSRAVKQRRRATASVEVKSAALNSGKGAGVQKRTGLERPQSYTFAPKDTAASKGRVVKTNS